MSKKRRKTAKRNQKRSKIQSLQRPKPIPWKFDHGIPTEDFFEHYDTDDDRGLDEALDDFIWAMTGKSFLTWEAVVCVELGRQLTRPQRAALSQLVCFDEPLDDEILYIDEQPRTTEPWYVIFSKIVSRMLVEPFRTFESDSWLGTYGVTSKQMTKLLAISVV